ncbi:hydroxyacid dehydrogenase [Candidatus Gracilibacteria bacterium]|nr:MAG: hydroxyacid dehydrogenase [Candidatus Gracilibacteria bacterium]
MENNKNDIIIYSSEDGKINIELFEKDGTIWLNQKQIVELFQSSKSNISEHITNIFSEKEVDKKLVVRNFRTTASDGKKYNIAYYNLEMILAIGFRVRSKRGTEFRIWANTKLKEFLQKGFLIDDERLKNPNGRYDYFDELLARIRDIRASEKRFYQKVRDLFALSIDYDKTDKATNLFFANTQNKLLYAITGNTASEIIINRADSNKLNMGLTNFKGSVVRKEDIFIAKNYLTEDEIDSLNRFVIVFLETAELKAKNREKITMDFWRENIDKIIKFNEKEVLKDLGSIFHKEMEKIVNEKYNEFDKKRKKLEVDLEDKKELEEIEKLEKLIKQNNKIVE